MNEIIARLKDFISKTGLSPRALALQCGIKQNTFSRQLNGSNELSFSTLLSICIQYPELSLEWLIRGDGKMFLTDIQDTYTEISPSMKKMSNIVLTLTQMVNDQESQIERLQEELKKYKP